MGERRAAVFTIIRCRLMLFFLIPPVVWCQLSLFACQSKFLTEGSSLSQEWRCFAAPSFMSPALSNTTNSSLLSTPSIINVDWISRGSKSNTSRSSINGTSSVSVSNSITTSSNRSKSTSNGGDNNNNNNKNHHDNNSNEAAYHPHSTDSAHSTQLRLNQTIQISGTNGSNKLYGDRFDKERMILQHSPLRHYVYKKGDIMQNKVVNRFVFKKNKGRKTIKQRYKEEAWNEKLIVDTLSESPLRTTNPHVADIFIIPTLPAAFIIATPTKTTHFDVAMENLRNNVIFKRMRGHRHVMVSTSQPAFDYRVTLQMMDYGFSYEVYRNILENVTIAREMNVFPVTKRSIWECERNISISTENVSAPGETGAIWHDYSELFWAKRSATRFSFSLGLLPGNHPLPFVNATWNKFINAKNTVFYHTKIGFSLNNSTVYRQSIVYQYNSTIHNQQNSANNRSSSSSSNKWDILRSSIGFGIDDPVEWARQFVNSKFCLVIRGDTPHTHALFRAVHVGCIPVVISDWYSLYAPTLNSTMPSMEDFGVVIPEAEYIVDPLACLKRVLLSLSEVDIQRKLEAIRFAQQLTVYDHPDGLFVPAFLREADLAMRRENPELFPYSDNYRETRKPPRLS